MGLESVQEQKKVIELKACSDFLIKSRQIKTIALFLLICFVLFCLFCFVALRSVNFVVVFFFAFSSLQLYQVVGSGCGQLFAPPHP